MKDPLAYQVFAILISRFIYQNFNEQEQIYLGQYFTVLGDMITLNSLFSQANENEKEKNTKDVEEILRQFQEEMEKGQKNYKDYKKNL